MFYRDYTVKQIERRLRKGVAFNHGYVIFRMTNELSKEVAFGIKEGPYDGYLIHKRTGEALVRRGYKIEDWNWTI
jgi:hypothetical protein